MLANNDEELKDAVSKCPIAVVLFVGRQCAICVSFESMLRSICRGYRNRICCIKVYSDAALAHVKSLGINSVPSLAAYVRGRPVAVTSGALYAPTVNLFLLSVVRSAEV